MKKINREMGTTFIFSTHDANIVRIADHVIRLHDGKVESEERREGRHAALVKLALLNLVEHKGKTLIVGVIIALGVTVLIAGAPFLDSASRALRRSFIDSFTGQVIITGKAHGNVALFGVAEMGAVEGTPLLPDFEKLTGDLKGNAEVKSFTFQISAAEQLNKPGEDAAGGGPFTYLFGIDPGSYGAMFNNIMLVSGACLLPGQEGILLSTSKVEEFTKGLGSGLTVGDKVLIQSFGNAIREVTLRGIFTFKERNAATDLISYIDPQTLRALAGMVTDSPRPAPALTPRRPAFFQRTKARCFREPDR